MRGSRQQSAYISRMRLSALSTAEIFVVCSLRLRVLPLYNPDGPHPEWREGFARARVDGSGAVGFDTLLRIFFAAATRGLDFRHPYSCHLGADEVRLLQILALLQHERTAEATTILSDCLPPAAARMAVAPAQAFASALAERGLSLPWRFEDTAGQYRPPPIPQPARVSHLVH